MAANFATEVLAAVRSVKVNDLVALYGAGHGQDAPPTRRPRTRGLAALVRDTMKVWVAKYGLTEIQAEILRRAALGETRSEITKARGCSELTIKTHIRNLLARTGDRAFHAALVRLLREVAREASSDAR